ncbi:MAG: hypothetical protein F4Z15_01530 [Gammaproteobacteria bacterium]|nr:hypothetical protein [Gammaproteobacteria bacterium]
MKEKTMNPAGAALAGLALCLMLTVTPDARSAGDWYAGINIPIMFLDDTETDVNWKTANGAFDVTSKSTTEYDTGFRFSGILGRQISPNLRLEGEFFIGKAKVSKQTYGGFSLQGFPIPQSSTPVSGSAK